MTIYEAMQLQYGDILHHRSLRNADNTPVRCKVTGKVKTWKTDNSRVKVPVKHGLRNCFYITEDNCDDWD